MRKVIVASLIGTSLEWYDFFIYGTAAALVFNKLFFPSFEPLVGTLLAFTTYAVGISVALLDRFDTSLAVSVYAVIMLLVTIICVLLAPETSKIDLHAESEDQPASAR